MKQKGKRAVFLILAVLLAAAFSMSVLAANKKDYTVRYSSPTADDSGRVYVTPSLLYDLLKNIDETVPNGEEFVYENELSAPPAPHPDFADETIEESGSLSMRGEIVEMPGTATPQSALYGTLTFRIERIRTVDNDHTYIDFETGAIKSKQIFTYDGPFTITVGDSEHGLVLSYDPFTRDDSFAMHIETFYYNADGKEVYHDEDTDFAPSAYAFVVSGGAPLTPVTQTINTDAAQTAGETSTDIPAIIVVGALATAAAAAAAGAGGAGSADGEGDETEPAKTYKMIVYKEFGDAIRYDKPPVFVYARMVEIDEKGAENERWDLTEKISIFSADKCLRVGTATPADRYVGASMEAESVKGQQNPTEGVVSFRFDGEGGSFQNNVKFRLFGEPYLRFAKEHGDELAVIEGDGRPYEAVFSLCDFIKEAKVSVKSLPDGAPLGLSFEPLGRFDYKLLVENHSVKKEPRRPTNEFYSFEIAAENETEYAFTRMTVTVYPEGLVVRGVTFDKEDHALLGAYADSEQSEGGEEVLATRFIVELAVPTVDEKGKNAVELVDVSKALAELAPLRGTTSATMQLAKTFEYEINDCGRGAYQFQPKKQIPEGKSPYYMLLPISCSYGGIDYKLDLPVRLLGEPFNELKAKQEELRILLARVRRYMPPEEWSTIVREFQASFDRMSVREIRLMNRSIYDVAQNRLVRESAELKSYAETLDWVIGGLEWVKWIGDQAFSILATMWTGPAGEAIIVPAKEIMVSFAAEYASEMWLCNATLQSQDQMTRGIRTNLSAMLENSLMSQIDTKKLDMKKLGAVLAAFAVLKCISHYFNDVGPDGKPVELLDAILSTFGDLTSTTFKLAFQQKFEQFVAGDKAKELYDKYATAWVREFLDSQFTDWQKNGVEVIQKYVVELCGEGFVWVYNKTSAKAGQTTFKQEAGDIVMTLNLYDFDPKENKDPILVNLNLSRLQEQIIAYIFDSMFAMFPFPAAPQHPPADPPYTPTVR